MGLDLGKLAWTGVAFAAMALVVGVSPEQPARLQI
jgi:hypothetical protein